MITALLQSMKDHDVALNPTLWIFAEGPAKDDLSALRTPWMNAVTKRAQDMGVVIAAGVDSLTTAGDPLPMIHRELEVEVTGAKLTPLQAITSATRGAAHAIGVDDVRGTVAAGKIADLLIVDADPSIDIRNTRRIRYVIKDGRIVATPGSARDERRNATRGDPRDRASVWPARRRFCAAATSCSRSRPPSIPRAPFGSSSRRLSSICSTSFSSRTSRTSRRRSSSG